ncbi:LysR family transcriptional regulator [Mesorhizobium sp. VK24D]|uniref:LysR family transcriptional regulator n=1 Tax=Mesorhizobium album TaxID=3072314 RepID=A0ABU4XYU3_9HYPH|nr:LysR family transcriptional regulator [Mesorhizobium sp. VK24D]MDX8479863.1 LysR family transcriptional regulator [Mesorhizobium sp. VK24D]
MQISLRHIEVFHAVMNAGSLTKAAEVMHTSQPTLSRELATLERLLGFTLFERRSRRLFATEKALLFHDEVQRSYVGLQQLVESARAIRDDTNSHVQIACLPLFAQTLLPRMSKRFLQAEPSCRLGCCSLDHSLLMRELLDLRHELGVIEVGVSIDGVEVEEVTVGEEVCVLPAGHPLAAREVIAPGDLDGEDLISYASSDPYRKRFHGLFMDPRFSQHVRLEVTTAEAICAFVLQGIGVALVNPISARAYRDRGLVVRPLSISIPFVVGICRPQGRPMTPLAAVAARLLVEECREMADELSVPGVWTSDR